MSLFLCIRLISEERIRDKHNSVRVSKLQVRILNSYPVSYKSSNDGSTLQRNVEERLRQHLKISDVAIPEPPTPESSEDEEEVEEVVQLPEITDEMEEVRQASKG